MSDEQLHLDITHWEPGDGHGSPLRRVDRPPAAPRFPSVFAGIDAPGHPEDDARHTGCVDCRRAFVPAFPDQRRCPRHQLEFDVRQSHAQARRAGPGLAANDVIL